MRFPFVVGISFAFVSLSGVELRSPFDNFNFEPRTEKMKCQHLAICHEATNLDARKGQMGCLVTTHYKAETFLVDFGKEKKCLDKNFW